MKQIPSLSYSKHILLFSTCVFNRWFVIVLDISEETTLWQELILYLHGVTKSVCPCLTRGTSHKHRWHLDPVPCPKCPSPGTQLGRGYTEPQISQDCSPGSTSITVMEVDKLVRVVTRQGYVSLYSHVDQSCQSSASCEGSPLGSAIQINIPNFSLHLSADLSLNPWMKPAVSQNKRQHTTLDTTF